MTAPDLLGAPREELEFLARSPNRVSVLDVLTRGPIERYELEETAGVTRATLGRVLDDFESRGWVTEDDRRYEATQLGRYVSREITGVLERFEPVPTLNEVARWFPSEDFGFDLRHLAGATVVRAAKSDVLAPTAHISDRIRGASRVQLMTHSVLPGVMETCWRRTVEDRLELLSVLDAAVFEHVSADRKMVEQARQMAASGRFEAYVSETDVSSAVFVVDDAVLLCLSGDEGPPLAVVETDDDVVRSWAESAIADRWRAGDRIDPSLYTA